MKQLRSLLLPILMLGGALSGRACDLCGCYTPQLEAMSDMKSANSKFDSEHAPDVAMAFRWNDKKNEFGVPGMIDADWSRKAGEGTHATLSRFDMHNTLIAAGPSIRPGYRSDLPSGNIDLAPTILHILGIAPPKPMDGRILSEALANSDAKPPKPETKTLEATRKFPSGAWRQTLQISRIGATIYLDEGNGVFTPNKKD